MILNKIRIVNYKSIKDVSVDVKKVDDSYTTIFVGLNETGKSNFLNAIGFINSENQNISFDDYKNRSYENFNRIEKYFTFSFDKEEWKDLIKNKIQASKEIIDAIILDSIYQYTFLEKGAQKFETEYHVQYKNIEDSLLSKLSFKKVINTDKDQKYEYTIKYTSEVSDTVQIKNGQTENTTNIVVTNYDFELLTKEKFQYILDDIFKDFFSECNLTFSKWEYKPEYLITQTIDLNNFKIKPESCYPLKNIFALAGYKNQKEIEEKINSISNKKIEILRLQTQLTKVLTNYVKQVWEECSLNFDIIIQDTMKLDVFIKDSGNDENYFFMVDRSDGAKHFLSLILSISVANKTDILKNNIISIDEPEVHMHPSGIRYIKDELLKIGWNNYVFVATHSQFIIDNKHKERHYIVTKKKNDTEIKQWDKTKEMADDEVLNQAFGINVLKDLLSPYKILVEGASDCKIIKKALNVLLPNNSINLTNGYGSNIVQVASCLKYYNVDILTILDSDEQGICYKEKVLKIGAPYNSTNVKDISMFVDDFVSNGTIEDTMDPNYIVNCFKENIKTIIWDNFNYDKEKPIINQIKGYILQKDQNIENLDEVIKDIKEKIAEKLNITKKSLQDKNPKLETLCNKILEYFNLKK